MAALFGCMILSNPKVFLLLVCTHACIRAVTVVSIMTSLDMNAKSDVEENVDVLVGAVLGGGSMFGSAAGNGVW